MSNVPIPSKCHDAVKVLPHTQYVHTNSPQEPLINPCDRETEEANIVFATVEVVCITISSSKCHTI